MRLFFLCFLVILNSCKTHSQQYNQDIDTKQITWEKDINEAFKKAKEQNKLVFVECYSPNCPYCMSIEPFFKDSDVATAYNTDFINVKLNVQSEEQIKFINDLNLFLPSFPKFFFFDPDKKLIHQSSIINTKEGLLTVHNEALSPKTQTQFYQKRFDEGERNVNFLDNYANHAIVIKDTMLNFKVGDELFKIYPKERLGSQESWEITKNGIRDANNGFAEYWFQHIDEAQKLEVKAGHQETAANNILASIIQTTLYSSKGSKMSSKEIDQIKKYMEQSGAGEYTQKILWNFYANAYAKEGKKDEALKIGEDIAKVFNTGPSLIYLSKYFIELIPNDKRAQEDATNWLKIASTKIEGDNLSAEYYYAQAKLDLDKNDKTSAKENIQKATEYAVKANMDLTKFTKLKNSI